MDTKTVIKKETKNRIHVDYEGKLTFAERMKKKLTSSNTWMKVVVNILRFILMLGVSYVILYPFFARIAGSFMTKEDVVDPTVSLIPKHFTLEIYKYLIIENHYFEALLNTTLLSLICALLQTFVACLIGYGLAKFKFKGNKLVFLLVILTMIVPHPTLQLSLFMKFRYFDILGIFKFLAGGATVGDIEWLNDLLSHIDIIPDTDAFRRWTAEGLNLTNTYWPMIILSLTGLGFKNGLYIFMLRQFFTGVPNELEESAYIDGSGTMRTFVQIILPLSIPMMITVFLFAFSWQWTDDFYTNLFFTTTQTVLMPDLVDIPESLATNYAGQNLYYAAIRNTCGLMIILPLVIMYVFCQRFLVQGIERSGLTAD